MSFIPFDKLQFRENLAICVCVTSAIPSYKLQFYFLKKYTSLMCRIPKKVGPSPCMFFCCFTFYRSLSWPDLYLHGNCSWFVSPFLLLSHKEMKNHQGLLPARYWPSHNGQNSKGKICLLDGYRLLNSCKTLWRCMDVAVSFLLSSSTILPLI